MGSQSSVHQLHGPLGNRSLSSTNEPVPSSPAGFLLLICTLPPAPSLTLQVGYREQSALLIS